MPSTLVLAFLFVSQPRSSHIIGYDWIPNKPESRPFVKAAPLKTEKRLESLSLSHSNNTREDSLLLRT